MDMRLYAGVDIGSATAKAVLVDADGIIREYIVAPSGGNLRLAADRVLAGVLEQAGGRRADLGAIVATGYGRESVADRDKSVTEIACHAKGAYALHPDARAVIDIGGQDSKVIALDAKGAVQKFEMNDKCAAGTGRFLEVMARTLEVPLDDFGPRAHAADMPATISSTCTVFAESEVISLLAQGQSVERILAGLCLAISQRINSLASRVGMTPRVIMTGGVARNTGVVRAVEKAIGLPITVPDNPQIVGALGAALLARIHDARRQAPEQGF